MKTTTSRSRSIVRPGKRAASPPTPPQSKTPTPPGRKAEAHAFWPPTPNIDVDLPRPGDDPSVVTDWANNRLWELIPQRGAVECHTALEELDTGMRNEQVVGFLLNVERLVEAGLLGHHEHWEPRPSALTEPQRRAITSTVLSMVTASRRILEATTVLHKMRSRAADTIVEEVAAAHAREVARLEAEKTKLSERIAELETAPRPRRTRRAA